MVLWRDQRLMLIGREVDKTVEHAAAGIEVELGQLAAAADETLRQLFEMAPLIEHDRMIVDRLSAVDREFGRVDRDPARFQGPQ